MEKDTLIDRLADEMEALKPPETTYKGWFRRVAVATDIPADSVKTYHAGTHECPGSRLLSLFDHFGPAFERRVRGTSAPPLDIADKLRNLADEVERGVAESVPVAGKIS